jgi:hypothetical protein
VAEAVTAAVDPDLAELAGVIERVPPDVLTLVIVDAKELLDFGAPRLGRIFMRLGPYLPSMKPPAARFFFRRLQDVTVWGKSWDWVADKVEASFPSVVRYLKSVAAAATPTGTDGLR